MYEKAQCLLKLNKGIFIKRKLQILAFSFSSGYCEDQRTLQSQKSSLNSEKQFMH